MARLAIRVSLIVAGLSSATALGQSNTPYLVKDINPNGTSLPIGLTAVGSRLFFNADDGTHGQELWISDGTEAGTYMVKDIVPGNDGSVPDDLTAVGDLVMFKADDNVAGLELWVSDGTEAGTFMVKDISPSTEGNPPGQCLFRNSEFVDFNGTLLFKVDDGVPGEELWRSDGTAAGTVLVKDPVAAGGIFSFQQLTAVGDFLVFAGIAPPQKIAGFDVWKSGGTAEGTFPLKDLRGAIWFRAVDGVALFQGDDDVTGEELWKTDGTPEGTVLVKDIHPTGHSTPLPKAVARGELYFSAFEPATGRELWKSDGTEEGTVLVKDLTPGPVSGGVSYAADVDGILFFGGSDGVYGTELWKTNGTEAGTVLIRDIYPGPESSLPKDLVVIGRTLYFTADDGVHGRELWMSDGSAAGTELIADINPGTGTGAGFETALVGGILFFVGGDGGSTGGELWAMDTRPPIPTVSAWGYVLMVLLLLSGATVIIRTAVRRSVWHRSQ